MILNASFLGAQTTLEPNIAITDYGPSAFYSYWKVNDFKFDRNIYFKTSGIYSTDAYEGEYYSQYLEACIPFAKKHGLNIRVPYHYYKVTPTWAQQKDFRNTEGAEWGDIDFAFTIGLWRDELIISDAVKRNTMIYLTAEMHTAPTGRDNKQFTDVIKLLGTINFAYRRSFHQKHEWSFLATIGGGGWDDIQTTQNHVAKQSIMLQYSRTIGKSKLGLNLGETFLYGEKRNDQGFLLAANLFYESSKNFYLSAGVSSLLYNEQIKTQVQQANLTCKIPIRFKKKEKKVKQFKS